jgi:ferrous iron transport protein A
MALCRCFDEVQSFRRLGESSVTLAEARPGDNLVVEPVTGQGIQRRLWDLGILPGSTVRVLARHPFRGPIVVSADGIQVAIGRGLAAKIQVSRSRCLDPEKHGDLQWLQRPQ